jgi:hypothetical protein
MNLELREEVARVEHSGPCFRDWCCDACYFRRKARAEAIAEITAEEAATAICWDAVDWVKGNR